MPLAPGRSRAVIQQNIREMVASGHPVQQAVAAALHNAGAPMKKTRPGSSLPKGRNYQGNRFGAGKDPDQDEMSMMGKGRPKMRAAKGKAKKRMSFTMPKHAMGLSAAMMVAGRGKK